MVGLITDNRPSVNKSVCTVNLYVIVISIRPRITFTVVADPDDQDGDCDELGSAEVDLNMV